MERRDLVSLASPVTNLSQYIRVVEAYPHLDEAEERELANRLRQDDDLDAAWQLVRSHLRDVVRIARAYAGYGLPQEDLIQEGNIGLMKAVKRFDPKRGVRLIVYATYWIRAQIHDFILRNWRIVRIATTKAKRKLFYKLRSAKQRLEWLTQSETADVASALDVSSRDVAEMEAKLYLSDVPFDGAPDAGEGDRPPAVFLEDNRYSPETTVARAEFLEKAGSTLIDALSTLDDRSREIVQSRWLVDDERKPTLTELGGRYGISAERVRQIETNALRRLRELVAARLDVDDSGVDVPSVEGMLA